MGQNLRQGSFWVCTTAGHSMYMMPPCCALYISRYVEQFTEAHASGLDPMRDLGVTRVKGRNGH
eukprot:5095612-Ditylum_brightwellii.AAC.1